jgi:hypothetical protein
MIKELIKFANHLDRKGLTKEADYVDNIVKKMAQEGAEEKPTVSSDHKARLFVFNEINPKSKYRKEGDKAKEGSNPNNRINVFKYKEAGEVTIGKILGVLADHALQLTFSNEGSGTQTAQVNELEENFPGITTVGYKVNHPDYPDVLSFKCSKDGQILVVIYEILL